MSAEALQWSKSTYSSDEGGACLEVALAWHKSTYSSDEGGQCLEVAPTPTTIHIRDSKNDLEDGPVLRVGPRAWVAFTSAR
ncbi:DUF397 domain-containing protein [Streptomyces sp. NBC_01235]|uniref:DUF397 domain-containing protein n=1 Tax=Streptomyces sp. NBC_01235 TaxID=2903788 RepID=UPI002E0FB4B8|nr:DUF397 domain-containing protein [Streptomyces sp. NBC_01235]